MPRLSVLLIFALIVASTDAFSSNAPSKTRVATSELYGLNRRDAVGLAFTGIVASLLPEVASASNPALETFKGGKKTKGSFIPGKGIREHETFEEIVMDNDVDNHFDTLIAENPALETFKGRKRTRGSFIPGKGIRERMPFDLV